MLLQHQQSSMQHPQLPLQQPVPVVEQEIQQQQQPPQGQQQQGQEHDMLNAADAIEKATAAAIPQPQIAVQPSQLGLAALAAPPGLVDASQSSAPFVPLAQRVKRGRHHATLPSWFVQQHFPHMQQVAHGQAAHLDVQLVLLPAAARDNGPELQPNAVHDLPNATFRKEDLHGCRFFVKGHVSDKIMELASGQMLIGARKIGQACVQLLVAPMSTSSIAASNGSKVRRSVARRPKWSSSIDKSVNDVSDCVNSDTESDGNGPDAEAACKLQERKAMGTLQPLFSMAQRVQRGNLVRLAGNFVQKHYPQLHGLSHLGTCSLDLQLVLLPYGAVDITPATPTRATHTIKSALFRKHLPPGNKHASCRYYMVGQGAQQVYQAAGGQLLVGARKLSQSAVQLLVAPVEPHSSNLLSAKRQRQAALWQGHGAGAADADAAVEDFSNTMATSVTDINTSSAAADDSNSGLDSDSDQDTETDSATGNSTDSKPAGDAVTALGQPVRGSRRHSETYEPYVAMKQWLGAGRTFKLPRSFVQQHMPLLAGLDKGEHLAVSMQLVMLPAGISDISKIPSTAADDQHKTGTNQGQVAANKMPQYEVQEWPYVIIKKHIGQANTTWYSVSKRGLRSTDAAHKQWWLLGIRKLGETRLQLLVSPELPAGAMAPRRSRCSLQQQQQCQLPEFGQHALGSLDHKSQQWSERVAGRQDATKEIQLQQQAYSTGGYQAKHSTCLDTDKLAPCYTVCQRIYTGSRPRLPETFVRQQLPHLASLQHGEEVGISMQLLLLPAGAADISPDSQPVATHELQNVCISKRIDTHAGKYRSTGYYMQSTALQPVFSSCSKLYLVGFRTLEQGSLQLLVTPEPPAGHRMHLKHKREQQQWQQGKPCKRAQSVDAAITHGSSCEHDNIGEQVVAASAAAAAAAVLPSKLALANALAAIAAGTAASRRALQRFQLFRQQQAAGRDAEATALQTAGVSQQQQRLQHQKLSQCMQLQRKHQHGQCTEPAVQPKQHHRVPNEFVSGNSSRNNRQAATTNAVRRAPAAAAPAAAAAGFGAAANGPDHAVASADQNGMLPTFDTFAPLIPVGQPLSSRGQLIPAAFMQQFQPKLDGVHYQGWLQNQMATIQLVVLSAGATDLGPSVQPVFVKDMPVKFEWHIDCEEQYAATPERLAVRCLICGLNEQVAEATGVRDLRQLWVVGVRKLAGNLHFQMLVTVQPLSSKPSSSKPKAQAVASDAACIGNIAAATAAAGASAGGSGANGAMSSPLAAADDTVAIVAGADLVNGSSCGQYAADGAAHHTKLPVCDFGAAVVAAQAASIVCEPLGHTNCTQLMQLQHTNRSGSVRLAATGSGCQKRPLNSTAQQAVSKRMKQESGTAQADRTSAAASGVDADVDFTAGATAQRAHAGSVSTLQHPSSDNRQQLMGQPGPMQAGQQQQQQQVSASRRRHPLWSSGLASQLPPPPSAQRQLQEQQSVKQETPDQQLLSNSSLLVEQTLEAYAAVNNPLPAPISCNVPGLSYSQYLQASRSMAPTAALPQMVVINTSVPNHLLGLKFSLADWQAALPQVVLQPRAMTQIKVQLVVVDGSKTGNQAGAQASSVIAGTVNCFARSDGKGTVRLRSEPFVALLKQYHGFTITRFSLASSNPAASSSVGQQASYTVSLHIAPAAPAATAAVAEAAAAAPTTAATGLVAAAAAAGGAAAATAFRSQQPAGSYSGSVGQMEHGSAEYSGVQSQRQLQCGQSGGQSGRLAGQHQVHGPYMRQSQQQHWCQDFLQLQHSQQQQFPQVAIKQEPKQHQHTSSAGQLHNAAAGGGSTLMAAALGTCRQAAANSRAGIQCTTVESAAGAAASGGTPLAGTSAGAFVNAAAATSIAAAPAAPDLPCLHSGVTQLTGDVVVAVMTVLNALESEGWLKVDDVVDASDALAGLMENQQAAGKFMRAGYTLLASAVQSGNRRVAAGVVARKLIGRQQAATASAVAGEV